MNDATQRLVDYPNTSGKRIAMLHYKWNNLDKVQESMYADKIISMAKSIDENIENDANNELYNVKYRN